MERDLVVGTPMEQSEVHGTRSDRAFETTRPDVRAEEHETCKDLMAM